MADKIKEFPIKKDLTVAEAASYAERRGAVGGIILFYYEDDKEGFCTFGSLKNKDILWLLEKQKLVTLNQIEIEEI